MYTVKNLPSLIISELKSKTEPSEEEKEEEGVIEGVGGGGGEEGAGKVSWHRNFCMTGITLCFKVE